MNTSISIEYTHPPIPISSRSFIGRVATRTGATMIRWADRSQERRIGRAETRRERSGPTYRIARRQAEKEREDARLRSSMMFWNIR